MAEGEPDPGRLLTALTTEHFGLQGARGATTSESSARTALYLGAVSSSLIGLGFVSGDRETFRVFALTVLPTLFFLGLGTFVRLVELGVEDFIYARAINRIRRHYLEIAGPEHAHLFLLTAHDDAPGVMRNMGLRQGAGRIRTQTLFTFATAIGVVNSVVGGAAVGLLAGVLGAPLGLAVGIGAVFALFSVTLHVRRQSRDEHWAGGFDEVLFPSPAPAARRR